MSFEQDHVFPLLKNVTNLAGKSAQAYQNMSIRPSFSAYPRSGFGGSSPRRVFETPFTPATLSSSSKGAPRSASLCVPSSEFRCSACPRHLYVEASFRHPDQMLEPPQLAPFTLSLRVRPTTLWRKLIVAACTCNRALSVTMHSS